VSFIFSSPVWIASILLVSGSPRAENGPLPADPIAEVGDRAPILEQRLDIRIRGLIQADGRQHLGDRDLALRDSFLIRRARAQLEATFFDLVDFRLMPDFGEGAATVQDAYIDVRPFSWLELRGGKFKVPLTLERLQSEPATVFLERSLTAELSPNRDLGFMLHGELGRGLFSYEVGIFNGVPDGGSGDRDNNHAKDIAARIFLQPWKGFGLGVAAIRGRQRGTPATFETSGTSTVRTSASSPALPIHASAGAEPFFSYRRNDEVPDATAIGRGWLTRVSPQGYFYLGGFGLLWEYIQSTQAVEMGPQGRLLSNRAWQAAACYVFGGESHYEGATVNTPLDPRKGSWGALELGVRYGGLVIDEEAFPTFADSERSARRADAAGAVLNWLWSRNLKLSVAFERTDFQGGSPSGDRRPENSLFQRIQASF
jgi:phosphate-selective porin OprO and OprP